jgi:membrane-bound ClpP family serine protease
LNSEGIARIHGELWQAIEDDPPIKPSEEISVVEHEGLMLTTARRNSLSMEGSH